MPRQSIVILGAGFGGLAAARELARRGGEHAVTVIDRSPFHVFTPLLYEVAAGFIEHENVGSAKLLRAGVSLNNADLLTRCGCNFVEGEIEGIDWDERRVLVRGKPAVAFDALVVALGAETNFYGVAGMAEKAYTLKSVKDADRLRQRIHNLLHMRESGTRGRLNVMIVGAGATGVELSAELTMFMRRHMLRGHLKPEDFSITLVEATARILGAMDPGISAFALERLHNLGVAVHLDSAVKEVMDGKAVLVPRACKPGETVDQLVCDFKHRGSMTVDADIVVWTAGIRGSAALEKLGLALDPRGKRIEVGPNLEAKDRPNVFAIGDAALLVDPRAKRPVPWLAQSAMTMGETIARTVVARAAGGPDAAYPFRRYPVIVPLGGKYAVANVAGMTFKGRAAWLLKEAANLRYFLTILPFISAIRHWWRGAMIYSKND